MSRSWRVDQPASRGAKLEIISRAPANQRIYGEKYKNREVSDGIGRLTLAPETEIAKLALVLAVLYLYSMAVGRRRPAGRTYKHVEEMKEL